MTAPRISVVVPAFVTDETLPQLETCLAAIGRNTLRPEAELLVVDDASPLSEATLEDAVRRHGGRYLRLAENRGPGVARNAGAREARGEILVFTDHDCVAHESWLEELVAKMGVEGGTVTSCYSGPAVATRLTSLQDADFRYRMPSSATALGFVHSCNLAIRRSLFLDVGGFPDQRVSEDMVFGQRLHEAGQPARFVAECGVKHHFHTGLRAYLRQRFSFARSTLLSYARSGRPGADGSTRRWAFNPLRIGCGMLASAGGLAAGLSVLLPLGPERRAAALLLLAACLLLSLLSHALFARHMARRHGWGAVPHVLAVMWFVDLAHAAAIAVAGVQLVRERLRGSSAAGFGRGPTAHA